MHARPRLHMSCWRCSCARFYMHRAANRHPACGGCAFGLVVSADSALLARPQRVCRFTAMGHDRPKGTHPRKAHGMRKKENCGSELWSQPNKSSILRAAPLMWVRCGTAEGARQELASAARLYIYAMHQVPASSLRHEHAAKEAVARIVWHMRGSVVSHAHATCARGMACKPLP